MTIDLDTIIKSLNERFSELHDYSFVETDPIEENRKTLQLHKMLTDLNEEITKYERIRANTNASTLTIAPASDQENKELRDALNSLNTAIQQDEAWHRAISLGTAVLEAAATLRSKTSAAPQPTAALASLKSLSAGDVKPTNKRIDKLLARHAKATKRGANTKGDKTQKRR